MKKEIPAVVEIYCDCCGFQCTTNITPRRENGRIYIYRDLLDQLGTPCANGGDNWDLCDHCLKLMIEAMSRVKACIQEDGK